MRLSSRSFIVVGLIALLKGLAHANIPWPPLPPPPADSCSDCPRCTECLNQNGCDGNPGNPSPGNDNVTCGEMCNNMHGPEDGECPTS